MLNGTTFGKQEIIHPLLELVSYLFSSHFKQSAFPRKTKHGSSDGWSPTSTAKYIYTCENKILINIIFYIIILKL